MKQKLNQLPVAHKDRWREAAELAAIKSATVAGAVDVLTADQVRAMLDAAR